MRVRETALLVQSLLSRRWVVISQHHLLFLVLRPLQLEHELIKLRIRVVVVPCVRDAFVHDVGADPVLDGLLLQHSLFVL